MKFIFSIIGIFAGIAIIKADTTATVYVMQVTANGNSWTTVDDPVMGTGIAFSYAQSANGTATKTIDVQWGVKFYSNNLQGDTPQSLFTMAGVWTYDPSCAVGIFAGSTSGTGSATVGSSTAEYSRSIYGTDGKENKKTVTLPFDATAQWSWQAEGGWTSPSFQTDTTTLTCKGTFSKTTNTYVGFASGSAAIYLK